MGLMGNKNVTNELAPTRTIQNKLCFLLYFIYTNIIQLFHITAERQIGSLHFYIQGTANDWHPVGLMVRAH